MIQLYFQYIQPYMFDMQNISTRITQDKQFKIVNKLSYIMFGG
jgi:hypothetical protein